MRNIEKMTSNRERLAYGETNERRERNNKRHKPERIGNPWTLDRYDPNLSKRLEARRKVLERQDVQPYPV